MATVEERHPELFKPDLHIDRQSGIRTVPMEVMNLGFPRTGTMCESLSFVDRISFYSIPFPLLLPYSHSQDHEVCPTKTID